MSGPTTAWWGRVFADGPTGGNHTVVVTDPSGIRDRGALAARLDVPDTAFVSSTEGEIVLRTFSPVEELAQCLQTSLAVLTALGVPLGEPRLVRHQHGEPLVVVREAEVTWAREAEPAPPDLEEVAQPSLARVDLASGSAPVVVRQARSRLHLRCADVAQLEGLELEPDHVLELCSRLGISGVVLSASGAEERVRVFTTSLGGREDSATGGAVLGLGQLIAATGVRGDLRVRQGPTERHRQGALRLRVQDDGQVLLGGSVHSLMSGGLCS